MHKAKCLYIPGLCTLLFIVFISCKKRSAQEDPVNEEPVPTAQGCGAKYGKDIKPIVISRCALSGCHVGNFSFGNFTTYADLKARVDNGKVKKLVFQEKLMPPSSATQLTEEELEKLKCWIDNGASED